MGATFRLGRIAGVEIGINWTWPLVVGLIGWSLAAGVFPETNPGHSDTTYALMAAVAVPVFFACLLLHELGHATRARREGMEIEGITLWLFGGVAQFRGAFPSAGAEFRIAIAGPLVSLALGVVLLLFAIAVPLPGSADGVVHWLGYINLTLLAFNLLPALPLDGGRVLRAALWQRKGDFTAATRTAAALGRGFGQFLVVSGIMLALLGAVGGLWFALIGWFLMGAAEAEAQAATAHTALGGRRVADVMVEHPVVVDAGQTIGEFIDGVFMTHRHTAYPVMEDGRAAGLITFRDATSPESGDWEHARVRDRMEPRERTLVLRPGDSLEEAWPALVASRTRRALVLDGDRLAGLLSATDVMRLLEVARRRG